MMEYVLFARKVLKEKMMDVQKWTKKSLVACDK